MKTFQNQSEELNETQVLQIVKEMIQVSKNKFKHDGILYIVWGWVLFYNAIWGYFERILFLTFTAKDIFNFLEVALPLLAFSFTLYYVIKQHKKVQTYIGISLRYVWSALFISMVLVNLIQFNVLHSINFELQHAIFMVLTAFALTITGGILRFRLISAGGIVFGIAALVASYVDLPVQLLIEGAAIVVAFIIPGHILFASRNK